MAAKPHIGGLLGLGVLAGLFSWWAWKDGAFFGTVLLPGTVALCAAVLVLARRVPWRLDPRASPAAFAALAALVLLGIWSLLSALWSPAPDIAVGDGQRILVYALCFGCGLWFSALLGRRPELAALPLVVAGGVAGIATVIVLLTGDDPRSYLERDGTLDYPLGYRNANAAFFAIAVFPAVGLAARPDFDWRGRAGSLAVATLCGSMFLFSQSRASLPAFIIALLVYLLASPRRLRSLGWLALAAGLALATLPAGIALHDAGDGALFDAVDEMRNAGTVAAVAAGVALLLGAAAALLENRLGGMHRAPRRSNRLVAAALAALVVVGGAIFVVRVGDPVGWADERIEEFRETGSPDLSAQRTRYTLNLGSDRYDLWRVAVDQAGNDPLLGTGGGGFEHAYSRDREDPSRSARDAHSIELEVLSELGIPGLALLAMALGGASLAILRSRRAGEAAAALAAVALASGAYWLLHASVDWFWAYPALTASVLALLGAACAPAAQRTNGSPGLRRWRLPVLATIAVLALSAIPPFLAERYVDSAFASWRTDLDRAYDDLDRARSLNSLSLTPLLAEGAIARAAGDRKRALDAFREAIEKRPEEWASHYLVAVMTLGDDRTAARAEAAEALRLNPFGARTRALAERLGIPVPPLPGDGD